MSDERDRVLDFIIRSEGEIRGLTDAANVIQERKVAHYQNAVSEQSKAAYAIRSLNNVGETLDVSLLNLDIKNSENLIADFFEIVRNVRSSIAREISNASRAAGESHGKFGACEDMQTTFSEKIVSTEAMIKNQKEILGKVEQGGSPGERSIGERPQSLKAQRAFQEITSEDSSAPEDK